MNVMFLGGNMNTNILLNKLFHIFNRPTNRTINERSKIFGSTIKSDEILEQDHKIIYEKMNSKILFHTYWCGLFGRKQCFSIKSLLATQNKYNYEVWLWLDEKARELNKDNPWIEQIQDRIKICYYNPAIDITESSFRKIIFLFDNCSNLAFRADGFRMWVLHKYGGVWFDLDIMFLKDLQPLFLGDEFIYAWENCCYGNNALIYLKKNSYLNRYLFKKVSRRITTQPWSLFDYKDSKLYGLKVYSASLFDPLWVNQKGNYEVDSFSDFFKRASNKDINVWKLFPWSYAYHWHNLWEFEIEENSYFELFESEFDSILKHIYF